MDERGMIALNGLTKTFGRVSRIGLEFVGFVTLLAIVALMVILGTFDFSKAGWDVHQRMTLTAVSGYAFDPENTRAELIAASRFTAKHIEEELPKAKDKARPGLQLLGAGVEEFGNAQATLERLDQAKVPASDPRRAAAEARVGIALGEIDEAASMLESAGFMQAGKGARHMARNMRDAAGADGVL
jgi:hypothetical protein